MSKLPLIVFTFVVIGSAFISWMEIMAKSLH
jgi:hypothetical protein